MVQHYIKNKIDDDILLVCDDKFTPLYEIQRETVAQKGIPKAFYINTPYGFMGAYASPQGPIFFINNEKYLFSDRTWEITVNKGEKQNQIIVKRKNKDDMIFSNIHTCDDPADIWQDENLDDPFIWLSIKKHDQNLIEMWTL